MARLNLDTSAKNILSTVKNIVSMQNGKVSSSLTEEVRTSWFCLSFCFCIKKQKYAPGLRWVELVVIVRLDLWKRVQVCTATWEQVHVVGCEKRLYTYINQVCFVLFTY